MDYRPHYPTFLRFLSTAIDAFLVLGGVSVLLLIFSNAVLRGTAGFDLAWSLEVTAFLLLWLTFLGCAAATARGAHMRVTEIVQCIFSNKMQFVLEISIGILICVLLLSLIYFGYSISSHTWAQKPQYYIGPLEYFMPLCLLACS